MATVAADAGFARYAERVKRIAELDAEEERILGERARAGDRQAADRLVESQLRLVIAIALEYRRFNTSLDDLVQQGTLGLLKAVQRFDPSKGARLRGYAALWIRAELRESVMQDYRIVRLGTTRSERRAIRAFRRHGVDSPEALAKLSGMPLARCRLLWPLLVAGDLRLDRPLADGSGQSRLETLSGALADPEHQVAAEQQRGQIQQRVERALHALPAREAKILRARLMDDEPPTLQQLGKRFGLSRERVRQLEAGARDKVKHALTA
ncbi:MAG: sigma-70 family RNA polymerase sigma factor [Myxococcales bacterium]|nr:sigma-70 family RNA polymerase sigma factor [Myxococcales bacterium]